MKRQSLVASFGVGPCSGRRGLRPAVDETSQSRNVVWRRAASREEHGRSRLSLGSGHRGAPRGAEITPVEPDPGHAGEGSAYDRNDTPSWGIEPVPERLRVLGTFDGFLLWANLSVSLLVIVAGAFLVLPADQFGLALSLPVALAAIVAAAVVGNLLLGLGGLIGADARVPTMVLLRAPLGRRGSYLPTGLNIVQCLGWSVFELIIIATGASALSKQVLGFGGVAFWKIALRPRRDGARAARAGRVRAQVRAQVRGLGRDRLAALPLLVVAARPAPRAALASRRRARVLARLRPRARVDHQLDAARRRLHPLLAHARAAASGAPASATSCRRSRCSRSAR